MVAHSVLQHSRIQRIEALKVKKYAEQAMEYVTALITDEYQKGSSNDHLSQTTMHGQLSYSTGTNAESRDKYLKSKENYLLNVVNSDEINEIKTKAIEIAQASMKLRSSPTGCKYPPDVALGTVNNVFSILGPHLGRHYGDIYIVFRREILHHPDANFSSQAATSYYSGNAFKWRPWLGNDPNTPEERVKLFHSSKLHASIPGYEYALALDIMSFAGLKEKNHECQS